MAEKMKAAGARVALVVTFGPTMNLTAPSNVSQVVNYYTGNTLVTRAPGFKGTISNVNLNAAPDINHLNIRRAIVFTPALSQKLKRSLKAQGDFGRTAVVQ